MSTPYSIKTLNADTAANAVQLGGVAASQYLQTNGNGSALTNLDAGTITTGTLANARLGQLPNTNIADSAVTAPKIATGQVVKGVTVSASTLTDNVTLAAGTNITITPAGNTVTIASSSGVGGSGTIGTVPLWSAADALSDSQISQDVNGVQMPNNVAFAAGAQGYQAAFGSPNGETGLSIAKTAGARADLRFDGSTVKLVARPAGSGPPPETNGIVVRTDGNVMMGYLATNTPDARLSVAASLNGEPIGTAIYGVTFRNGGTGIHGGVGFGVTNALAGVFDGTVAVNGTLVADSLKFGLLTGGTGAQLCSSTSAGSSTGFLSYCSSSRRYKRDFRPFEKGLSFVHQLEPIRYNWKSTGSPDIGFGAEDVEKIDPLFVTYNAKGQVEGIKYDRLSVVLVNAIKEQQAQIEAQQKLINQQHAENTALILRVAKIERTLRKKKGRR
jgi:hypothetical protein